MAYLPMPRVPLLTKEKIVLTMSLFPKFYSSQNNIEAEKRTITKYAVIP